ncbi:phage tail tape measure protein [Rhodococcus sp. D2-41]|uniref:phage tail tape measure protein n=1 Tax=Speluncibacter jeojiensis TaxID=2710754 RepID=UPI00240FD1B1|nr:phage tail tape measure protein [Rhodococcus sp. D2-41]MDG3012142.1 phage tail tape measure protein [Rhodococcus sp. D2-41]
MTTIGYAALQVIPVLKGLQGNLAGELGAPLVTAGKKAGQDAGQAVAVGIESAKAAVEKASGTLAAARDKEASASDKVRVAELKLQETRDKSNATASQIAAAEARVADAKRGHEAATRKVSAASADYERAQDGVKRASDDAATGVENIGKKSIVSGDHLKAFGAIAAGAVGMVGKQLFDMGSQFDEMSRTIVMTTGASGDKLKELNAVATQIGRETPASFEEIGKATAQVNQTMGLTGDALKTVGRQVVELGGLQGAAINVQQLGKAMRGFGVESQDTGAAMDQLFKASQNSGVSVNDLVASLDKGGPSLRALGLNIGESADLMTRLEKSGLDADAMTKGLAKGLVNVAKPGEDMNVALNNAVDGIDAMLAAGDEAGALDLSAKLFGAKQAPAFLDALQAGVLNLDNLHKSAAVAGDGILATADATVSFKDKLVVLKNNIMADLQPVAERVFGDISKAMDFLGQHVDVLKPIGAILGSMGGAILAVVGAVKAWTIAQAALNLVMDANPVTLIVVALAGLVAGVIYAYKHFEGFRKVVQSAWDGIKTATSAVWNGFLKPTFAAFGKVISGVASGIAKGIGGAVDFIKDHWRLIITIIGGPLGALVAVVTKYWDQIKGAFTVAWNAIGAALSFTWNSIIKPVFDGLALAARIAAAVLMAVLITPVMIAWNLLSGVIQSVWVGVIKPVFDGLAAVASWLWMSVLAPTWEAMQAGFSAVGAFFQMVWTSVIQPAWNALGAGISWVWTNVVSPAWGALKAALGAVGSFFAWVWNSVINPAWTALGNGINWVWANVINPAWSALKAALGAVGDFFKWVWENVIKPAWDGLGAGIRWVIDNVITPAWTVLKSGLDTVKTAFDSAVGFIGKVWDTIRGIVAKPVKFVVDAVYNNGIRNAWNKVAGWLHLPELPEAKLGELAKFATGGRVSGPGGPTDDKIPAMLSNGEYVLNAKAVSAIGTSNLDRLNYHPVTANGKALAEGMFVGANGRTYLAGGGSAADAAVGRAKAFMAGEDGKPYQYGGVGDPSWDCSGLWSGIINVLNGMAARSGRQFNTESNFESMGWKPGLGGRVSIGVMRGGGGENSHMAGTIDGTNAESSGDNGVRWGGPARGADNGMFGLRYFLPEIGGEFKSGGSGSGGGGLFGWLRRRVADAFNAVMAPIGRNIPAFGDSDVGRLPKTVFDHMRGKVYDFLAGKAGSSEGGSSTPGTGPVMDQVKQAFAAYGWDTGAEWDAAQWIIGKESSWNPTNRNPDGGAFGLFQFKDSTKAQYLPDENPNPGIQGAAGARYIKDRYGDPLAAKAFWEQNGWYDNGGIANGIGAMMKNTLKPERVLSPEMTEAFERLVKVLERPDFVDVLRGMTGGPVEPSTSTTPGGSTPSSTPPVGGTGAESAYSGEKRYGLNDFAKANTDQFLSDLGVSGSDGALPQLFKLGAKGVNDGVTIVVADVQEAFREVDKRRRQQAAGMGGSR